MNEDVSKVTRLELVDHTACTNCKGVGRVLTETDSAAGQSTAFSVECPKCRGSGTPGRSVVFWDPNRALKLSLQDDGRTLKIFISERVEEEHTAPVDPQPEEDR